MLKFSEALNDLIEAGKQSSSYRNYLYVRKRVISVYVIIDLPQVLLLSAVYLKTLFPSASIFIYGDKPIENVWNNPKAYDFILLPHYIV